MVAKYINSKTKHSNVTIFFRKLSRLRWVIVGALLFLLGSQITPLINPTNYNEDITDKDDKIVKLTSHYELDALTKKVLGLDEFGSGCPKSCGCPHTKIDCTRHYKISDVIQSANAILDKKAIMYYDAKLEAHHMLAAQECLKGKSMESGGWCLSSQGEGKTQLELLDGRNITIPKGHVVASKNIVDTLLAFFRVENIRSISDYGAGVGQYGIEFKTKMPQLVYHGYDGAGDIESYTSGLLHDGLTLLNP
jgi:hypothetical protein